MDRFSVFVGLNKIFHRFIRLTPLVFIICLTITSICSAQEFFPFLGEITAENVRVRAGQNENFEELCLTKKSENVIVVDKDFSWYKVRLPKSAKAYIIEKYVNQIDSQTLEVTASQVNIRARSSINSTILGQVNKGDKLIFVNKKDDWYQIEPIEFSFGWVLEKFVHFKSQDITLYNQPKVEEVAVVPDSKIVEISNKDSVVVTGKLKAKIPDDADNISYRLDVDNKPSYYLEGMKYLLDKFIPYSVKVEGTIKENSQLRYPIIVVSKIQIIY